MARRLVLPAILILASLALVDGVRAEEAADGDVERALLELNVRTALLEKIGLPAADISVKATLGEVWLLGTVKSDSASETAEDVAEEVAGVKTVHNQVKVLDHQAGESTATHAAKKVESNVDDGLLELRLKSRLIAELGRSAFRLEVESHAGVVNLTGTAPDAARHDLAIRIAERVPGVKKVIDLLKVTG